MKPDNVGFTADGTLKLFDFGLCTCVKTTSSPGDVYEMTGNTGSLRYMAPEVALRKSYNEKVDVYSYGIMAWQMARDRVPFKGLSKIEFFSTVVNGENRPSLDKSWPARFSALLEACWNRDYRKRPSFREIVVELDILHFEYSGRSIHSSTPPGTPPIPLDFPMNNNKKGPSPPVSAATAAGGPMSQILKRNSVRSSPSPSPGLPSIAPASSPSPGLSKSFESANVQQSGQPNGLGKSSDKQTTVQALLEKMSSKDRKSSWF